MTTTDRRDATDAQFADELARLDRLDLADVAADVAEAAALEAVRDMPADWYCPGDLHTQRINCPSCIAEIAARAAIVALKPAPGADSGGQAVRVEPYPWTSHGHAIPGIPAAGKRPLWVKVRRCGGITSCRDCRYEVARATGQPTPRATPVTPAAVAGPQRDGQTTEDDRCCYGSSRTDNGHHPDCHFAGAQWDDAR